jgi:hypothetical protein
MSTTSSNCIEHPQVCVIADYKLVCDLEYTEASFQKPENSLQLKSKFQNNTSPLCAPDMMHAFLQSLIVGRHLTSCMLKFLRHETLLLLHYGRAVPSMMMKDQYAGRVLFIMKP